MAISVDKQISRVASATPGPLLSTPMNLIPACHTYFVLCLGLTLTFHLCWISKVIIKCWTIRLQGQRFSVLGFNPVSHPDSC